jgi:hypothetical protein
MEQDLEAWANGPLTQARANRIRHVLAAALGQRMDWNSLRMAYGQIKKEFFWLPYAQVGNPTATPKFEVAAEVRPVPATTRRALAALDRWDVNGNSWSYPSSEDDYAYAQALLDQLEQQARAHFIEKAERDAALLGRTLHRQALLLRLSKRADPAKPRLSELLAPAEPVQATEDMREIPNVGALLALQERATQSRDALRKLYLGTVCCFQGDGATPHAIDAARVTRAWKAAEGLGDFGQIRFDDGALSTAINDVSSTARLKSLVDRQKNAVRSLMPSIVELAGPAFDATVPAASKAVLSSARRAGVLAAQGINMAEIDRSISWLETREARDFLSGLRDFTELADDDTLHAQLAAWARVDLRLLVRADQTLRSIATLIQATQRNATAQLRAEGGADVAENMGRLITSLRSLGDAP